MFPKYKKKSILFSLLITKKRASLRVISLLDFDICLQTNQANNMKKETRIKWPGKQFSNKSKHTKWKKASTDSLFEEVNQKDRKWIFSYSLEEKGPH